MAIKYTLIQGRDLSKGADVGDKLWYAKVKSNGTVTFDEVCENIAHFSTASKGDVKVVLEGLIYEIKRALKAGQIIQIEGLGNFQASAGSSGVANAEDFDTALFKEPKVLFRASKALKTNAKEIKFEREGVQEQTAGEEEDRPDIE